MYDPNLYLSSPQTLSVWAFMLHICYQFWDPWLCGRKSTLCSCNVKLCYFQSSTRKNTVLFILRVKLLRGAPHLLRMYAGESGDCFTYLTIGTQQMLGYMNPSTMLCTCSCSCMALLPCLVWSCATEIGGFADTTRLIAEEWSLIVDLLTGVKMWNWCQYEICCLLQIHPLRGILFELGWKRLFLSWIFWNVKKPEALCVSCGS